MFDIVPGDDNAALKDIIAERIRRDGPISFETFMEMALYHPHRGYYFTSEPSRDYQSSPNVHPVFGGCIARQLGEMWRLLGSPAQFDVLECGAGDGRLAGDILRWLRRHDRDAFATLRYVMQDATYEAGRVATVLDALGVNLRGRVEALAELPPPGNIAGCIISNELIDAFPFRRVRFEGGRLLEVMAGLEDDRFIDVSGGAPRDLNCYFDALGLMPGEGCEAEVNLAAPSWMRQAAEVLERGYVLTLDYGYEATELYAPWRKRGTLLTFYRHTSGENPYVRVGRQDITASVDFTTLVEAGRQVGLEPVGLTTQADFLAALGVGEGLHRRPEPGELPAYYALRRSVVELSDPAGLGRIKVLIQAKAAPAGPLMGLATGESPRA